VIYVDDLDDEPEHVGDVDPFRPEPDQVVRQQARADPGPAGGARGSRCTASVGGVAHGGRLVAATGSQPGRWE
jgi:hypothetical protein